MDATGTVYTSTVPTAYQIDHPGDLSDVGGPVVTYWAGSDGAGVFQTLSKTESGGQQLHPRHQCANQQLSLQPYENAEYDLG